jgi:DNA-binding IclR family transcriptional regulator
MTVRDTSVDPAKRRPQGSGEPDPTRLRHISPGRAAHHPSPRETYVGGADGTGSTDNILRLLLLLGERRQIRLSDVVTELGVAKSTAHRMLSALRRRGFATHEKPNGAYFPGPALLTLGLHAVGRLDIRRVAQPVLGDLRARTQETVSLLVPEGRAVRFVESIESPRAVRVSSRLGLVLPAHVATGGKAFLAELAPAHLRRLYPLNTLDPVTEHTIATWPQLVRELEEVRRQGYAVTFGESELGVSAVGVAIHDPYGLPIAAVAVAAPEVRIPDRTSAAPFAELLKQAAREIEELLVSLPD